MSMPDSIQRTQEWLAGRLEAPDLEAKAAERMSSSGRFVASNYSRSANGFSSTVATELEAYRAAFDWRFKSSVQVEEAPNVGGWLVIVTDPPVFKPCCYDRPTPGASTSRPRAK